MVTEAEDADDLELLRWPAEEDPNVVAHRVPVLVCGRGIHRDFVLVRGAPLTPSSARR